MPKHRLCLVPVDEIYERQSKSRLTRYRRSRPRDLPITVPLDCQRSIHTHTHTHTHTGTHRHPVQRNCTPCNFVSPPPRVRRNPSFFLTFSHRNRYFHEHKFSDTLGTTLFSHFAHPSKNIFSRNTHMQLFFSLF